MPIEPASFVAVVDNPWFLLPGTTFHYRGVADGELADHRHLRGHAPDASGRRVSTDRDKDTVRVRGVVEETHRGLVAQDVDGDIILWYFGEATSETR